AYFIDDFNAQEKAFNPLNNGVLGTLTTRIDIAYLLGLISKELRDLAKAVAKIRNGFAHSYQIITFENFVKQDKEGAKRISDLRKKLAFLYANIPEEKKVTFLRDGKRNFSTAM